MTQQFNYNNQANQPGIYVIFNKEKWRIYVGQTHCFKDRWRDHVKNLRESRHQNRFLQADWNLCGSEAFEFHVLEVLPNSTKSERNAREDHWLEIHWDKQQNCYNFHKKSESLPRSCFSKNPEETRKFISQRSKEAWADPESRTRRMKTHTSPEFREKQRVKRLEIAANRETDPSRLGTIAAWQNEEKSEVWRAKIKSARAKQVFTPETREKLKQIAIKRGCRPPQSVKRSVIGTNILTGETTRFESAKQVQDVLGIKRNRITDVARGRKKSAGGYRWEYAI